MSRVKNELPPPRLFLSVSEIAVMLGCHRNTIYKALLEGDVPHIVVGNKTKRSQIRIHISNLRKIGKRGQKQEQAKIEARKKRDAEAKRLKRAELKRQQDTLPSDQD